MKREPRDYQIDCVKAVNRAVDAGFRDLYYTLPTGCGKTRIMTMLIEHFCEAGRVLVIAHRKELIEQTVGCIVDDLEGVNVGIVMGEQNDVAAQIIVGTWQSLSPLRLEAVLSWDEVCSFSLIMIDESHHVIPGSAYERIIQMTRMHSPNVVVVGCTATPFRSDKKRMQDVLSECVYERSIPAMQQAGWLAPLRWRSVTVDIDLSDIQVVSIDGEKDYDQTELYKLVGSQTVDIVKKTALHFGSRPVLVFAVNVEHAHKLAVAYNEAGITTVALSAKTNKGVRASMLEAWRAGQIQAICNVVLLTEGFDYTPLPPNKNGLGVVVVAAPTMSSSRYLQMIGRGTRLKPAEGEFEDCLVIDLAGNANLLETKQIVLPKVLPSFKEKKVLEEEEEEEEEKQVRPERPAVIRTHDPLAISWLSWGYSHANDIYYANLSSIVEQHYRTDTYAAIIPSQRGDGLFYAFVLTRRAGTWQEEEAFFDRAKPLNEVMHHINHVVSENGLRQLIDKGAKWRRQPATEAQLAYLGRIAPEYASVADDWTRGEISSFINWIMLKGQLKKLVYRIRDGENR